MTGNTGKRPLCSSGSSNLLAAKNHPEEPAVKKPKTTAVAPDVATRAARKPTSATGLQKWNSSAEDDAELELYDSKATAVVRSDDDLARQEDVKNLVDKLPNTFHRLSDDEFDSRTATQRLADALLIRGPIVRNVRASLQEYTATSNISMPGGKRRVTRTRWHFAVLDDSDKVYYVAFYEQDHLPRADAEAVCKTLADIVMRWPGSIDSIATTEQKPKGGRSQIDKVERYLVPLVLRRIRGPSGCPIRAIAPTYQEKSTRKTSAEICGMVITWDPAQFTTMSFLFVLSQADLTVTTVQDPPDDAIVFCQGRVKAGITWHGKDETDEHGQACFPSAIPNDLPREALDKYRAMERLARRIIYELNNKVFTKADFDAEVKRLKQLYGTPGMGELTAYLVRLHY